jgi:hypothetical protein
MPREAGACPAGVILDVARGQQDAGIAQQDLSGRVSGGAVGWQIQGLGGGVKMAWVPTRRQMTWGWPSICSAP